MARDAFKSDDDHKDFKDYARWINKANAAKRTGLKLDKLSHLGIIKAAMEAKKALNRKQQLQDKFNRLLKEGKITEEERAKIQERINKSTKNNGDAIERNLKKRLKENKVYAGASKFADKIKTSFENLPATVFALIVKSAFELDKQVTSVARQLGISKEHAFALRSNLAKSVETSDNLRLNATEMLKSQAALNDLRGTAEIFEANTLKAVTNILHAKLLTNEEATELYRTAQVTGKTFEGALLSQIGSITAINKQRGISLNYNKVLAAANKITGQIRAQLEANPEAIGRATALAHSFGMELEDLKNVSSALLDFESSIAKELEAELLTGKQINLEKARLYALTGDYEGLMREINENVGDFYSFSKMNVLEQNAMADALGYTSDQLSDMLFKEADLETMKQTAIMNNDKEMLQRLTMLDTQEKFNLAVQRMKELFIEFIAPYVEKFVLWLQEGEGIGEKIKKIFNVGIKGGLIAMGVLLAARIVQMGLMVGLMATQLSLAAATAGAQNPTAGVSFGATAVITAGIIIGAVALGIAKLSSMIKLGEGGIVPPTPGGTPAIIGEAGEAEVVIPLSQLDTMIGGTDKLVTSNFTLGSVIQDFEKRTESIVNSINKKMDEVVNSNVEKQTLNVTISSNPFDSKSPNYGKDHHDNKYNTLFV